MEKAESGVVTTCILILLIFSLLILWIFLWNSYNILPISSLMSSFSSLKALWHLKSSAVWYQTLHIFCKHDALTPKWMRNFRIYKEILQCNIKNTNNQRLWNGSADQAFSPHRCRRSSLVMSPQAHPETPGARRLVRPVTPRDCPSKTKMKHDQEILLISMLRIYMDIKKEKNYFMVNVWNKYFTKEIANKYIKYISF